MVERVFVLRDKQYTKLTHIYTLHNFNIMVYGPTQSLLQDAKHNIDQNNTDDEKTLEGIKSLQEKLTTSDVTAESIH